LRAAKKANIPIRIAHSHSTTNKKEWKKNLLKQVLRPFSKVYANQYFACSELAGRWLFGNKFFEKGKVTIINNAIDTRKFQYNEETRKKKRKELNINQDTLVIGHIGRFVEQKNQLFLLEVFNELHKANTNSILILIGQGPMVSEVKNKIKELKLEDTVFLIGQRDDVADLYQALDVFVLPSLYEGLGMVLIEAQCSGLPCIASTEVPNIAKINSNFKYIDLKKPATIWSNEILILAADNKRNTDTKRIRDAKFDIKEEAFNLEKAYEDMVMNMNT